MVDKVKHLVCQINVWGTVCAPSPSMALSPNRKIAQSSRINPNELAIALSLLEGDKYKVLVPFDYLAYLKKPAGHNNIEGMHTTNNEIILWVKDSVLHHDTVEKRADDLNYFINTAQECRKLRNFSSLVAIAIALHSVLEPLKLTKSSLTFEMQDKLQDLYDIIDPTANYRGYWEGLNDVSSVEQRDRCIPWLAVHLNGLRLVLQTHPIIVQVDGRPLINFQRYLKFMERVNEVVYYKSPVLEQFRPLGLLAHLENQLEKLRISPTSDDDLMKRIRMLETREISTYNSRTREIRALGFRRR
jgi:son of sevenless-like protein